MIYIVFRYLVDLGWGRYRSLALDLGFGFRSGYITVDGKNHRIIYRLGMGRFYCKRYMGKYIYIRAYNQL